MQLSCKAPLPKNASFTKSYCKINKRVNNPESILKSNMSHWIDFQYNLYKYKIRQILRSLQTTIKQYFKSLLYIRDQRIRFVSTIFMYMCLNVYFYVSLYIFIHKWRIWSSFMPALMYCYCPKWCAEEYLNIVSMLQSCLPLVHRHHHMKLNSCYKTKRILYCSFIKTISFSFRGLSTFELHKNANFATVLSIFSHLS